ncbi:MAG: DUF397 domain-containing protein [Streptosporangiaceae bacterium]
MLRAISGRPRRSFVILSLSYRILNASNGRAVRDSKHPEGPILVFTRDEWRAFIQAVEAGKLHADLRRAAERCVQPGCLGNADQATA